MITRLDDKYIVLKRSDVEDALHNEEYRDFLMYLDFISLHRLSQGRTPSGYVVVSEVMKCFNDVYNTVLKEINDEENIIASRNA